MPQKSYQVRVTPNNSTQSPEVIPSKPEERSQRADTVVREPTRDSSPPSVTMKPHAQITFLTVARVHRCFCKLPEKLLHTRFDSGYHSANTNGKQPASFYSIVTTAWFHLQSDAIAGQWYVVRGESSNDPPPPNRLKQGKYTTKKQRHCLLRSAEPKTGADIENTVGCGSRPQTAVRKLRLAPPNSSYHFVRNYNDCLDINTSIKRF